MARASIPVTQLTDAGVADPTETDGDPVNGHSLPNTGKTVLRVRNADTASHTLTLGTPVTVEGHAVADTTVTIPASATRTVGHLDRSLYGGNVPVDVDSAQLKLVAFEP